MSVVSDTTLDAKVPAGPIEEKWDRHRFDLKLVAPNNKRKFDIVVVGTGLAGAAASASFLFDHRIGINRDREHEYFAFKVSIADYDSNLQITHDT